MLRAIGGCQIVKSGVHHVEQFADVHWLGLVVIDAVRPVVAVVAAVGSHRRLPDLMRDKSSTSFIISGRCQPDSRICSTQPSWVGPSGWRLSGCSSCGEPSIAFSGVRSAGFMRERKSVFAQFAEQTHDSANKKT